MLSRPLLLSPRHISPRQRQLNTATQCTRDVAQNQPSSCLFVCLGNICRSPAAEAVFRSIAASNGLTSLRFDSCGTGGGSGSWYCDGGYSYHEGEDSDDRMKASAQRRGVDITSRSRPLTPEDLTSFDLIIAMDAKNVAAIKEAHKHWQSKGKSVPDDLSGKVKLMTDYSIKFKGATSVPDPYYGGEKGFEQVLDLLEDASEGLVAEFKHE